MRIRQVDAINNGDVLTEAIMNEQKNVIIPAGTVLKVDYIPLIKSLGVDTVMIDDPYENYENTHTIIPKESFDQYVAKVQKNTSIRTAVPDYMNSRLLRTNW